LLIPCHSFFLNFFIAGNQDIFVVPVPTSVPVPDSIRPGHERNVQLPSATINELAGAREYSPAPREDPPPPYSEVVVTIAAPLYPSPVYDPTIGIESRISFKKDEIRRREEQFRNELRNERERTTRGFDSKIDRIRIESENLSRETSRVQDYWVQKQRSLASSRSTTQGNIDYAQKEYEIQLKGLDRKRQGLIRREKELESEMRSARDDERRKQEQIEQELRKLRKELDDLMEDLSRATRRQI